MLPHETIISRQTHQTFDRNQQTGFLDLDLISVDDDPNDSLNINGVIVKSLANKCFAIPISVKSENTEETTALIDSGAEGMFVDISIAQKWRKTSLVKLVRVWNVDGTANANGEIKEKCLITINCQGEEMTNWFYVMALGDQNFILGLPWLKKYNPVIKWREKTLEFHHSIQRMAIRALTWSLSLKEDKQAMPEWENDLVVQYLMSPRGPEPSNHTSLEASSLFSNLGDLISIQKVTPAQQMEQNYCNNEEKTQLPPEYMEWNKVFEKTASEQFPEHHTWDHTIELRKDFIVKKGKIYALSLMEQNSLDDWIKEQLAKGYIQQSKSPQSSPFFFVPKKESNTLCPCQDYQYLNEYTKPNVYPLPLISDLMINLKGSKFFTKLDL